MNVFAFFLLIVGGVILTIGDIIMKKWTVTNEAGAYLMGMAVYLVGMHFLAHSFKYKSMATASTIFVVINVVTLIIFSWVYFKEPVSIYKCIGIALAVLAIWFMEK
jgi:multidrug transporter EmrE-like cation transporter